MIKDIFVRLITKPDADRVVKKLHYSGKVTSNSQINFGVFHNNVLLGAAQFGPSIDKRRMGQSLGIGMNESLELNRLAIDDKLGKNAESRVLGICLRMIKKQYPFIRCIISFADACQCGDGTIYRASNFKLHSFKRNDSLFWIPGYGVIQRLVLSTARPTPVQREIRKKLGMPTESEQRLVKALGGEPIAGYQMKYIYYFDKELEKSHPSIPFDKIPDEVKMYKGTKRTKHDSNASTSQVEEGGAEPTSALQLQGQDDR